MFMKRGYLDQQRHTRDVVAQRKDPVRVQQEYNHGQDHVQDKGRNQTYQSKTREEIKPTNTLILIWKKSNLPIP